MSWFSILGIVHPGLFCAAVLLLNLTPGPDTAFIVGQSVAHGRRAGLLSVLGISTGCAAHTVALALGLSAVLAASAGAFAAIKVVGAIYLVFLGTRMIVGTLGRRAPGADPGSATSPLGRDPPVRPSAGRTFTQGFVTNVLNPKVILFFLSFFPQFVASGSGHEPAAFLVLGAVMIAISTVYNGLVACLAGGITTRMRSTPHLKAWLDRSIGAAFVALGARIAFVDR